ncbi:unnamed protein product [Rhizophagus irregularis]|nr:unnamed protein product [Rhizophagus irregularis]
MTSQTLQQYLNEGNWRGAKLSLKFFGELTNANVILPRTIERTILDIDGSVIRKSIQPYVGPNVPYEQQDMLELLWTIINT